MFCLVLMEIGGRSLRAPESNDLSVAVLEGKPHNTMIIVASIADNFFFHGWGHALEEGIRAKVGGVIGGTA